jgi:hypothetical protein
MPVMLLRFIYTFLKTPSLEGLSRARHTRKKRNGITQGPDPIRNPTDACVSSALERSRGPTGAASMV